MLIRGRTSRLPGHKEARFLRGRVDLRTNTNFTCFEFLSTQSCRYVQCEFNTAAVPGGGNPPPPTPPRTPPLEHAPSCRVPDIVWCLDTAAVSGGGSRARPLVLGPRYSLVLGHSSRAGGGGTPPDPPPRARPLVLGPRYIDLFFKKTQRKSQHLREKYDTGS